MFGQSPTCVKKINTKEKAYTWQSDESLGRDAIDAPFHRWRVAKATDRLK